MLLWDAILRALRAEQANFTLLVDAKDDAAIEFYRHYGFASFATINVLNRMMGLDMPVSGRNI